MMFKYLIVHIFLKLAIRACVIGQSHSKWIMDSSVSLHKPQVLLSSLPILNKKLFVVNYVMVDSKLQPL